MLTVPAEMNSVSWMRWMVRPSKSSGDVYKRQAVEARDGHALAGHLRPLPQKPHEEQIEPQVNCEIGKGVVDHGTHLLL